MGMGMPILVGLGLGWGSLLSLVVPGCAGHIPSIPVPCWDCPCHAGIAPLSLPSASSRAVSPFLSPNPTRWGVDLHPFLGFVFFLPVVIGYFFILSLT